HPCGNRHPDRPSDPLGPCRRCGQEGLQAAFVRRPDFERAPASKYQEESVMKKLLGLVPALLMTACVATPPTDPQVTAIAPESLGLGAANAPAPQGEWWVSFKDPQIERLANMVVANK